MTVRDVTDLNAYEAELDRRWREDIRPRRAWAARMLRSRRIVPTREAIDAYLEEPTTYAHRRSEDGWL